MAGFSEVSRVERIFEVIYPIWIQNKDNGFKKYTSNDGAERRNLKEGFKEGRKKESLKGFTPLEESNMAK